MDSIAIEEELRKWGIPLRLDFTQWRAPPKPLKKNRGRKAVLKVTPSESDESEQYESDEELKGVAQPEVKEPHGPDSDVEDPDEDTDAVPEVKVPEVEVKKGRPAPKRTKKTESETGLESEEEAEDPDAKEKKPTGPKKKGKKEKVKGTPLDAELKKEDMEEKAPKKGKYRGKKESLVEVKWNEEDYLFKDGKYYVPETLELVAWTNASGEIILM